MSIYHRRRHKQTGYVEYIAIMASLMSLAAFSIDALLPALHLMGEAFQLPNSNDQQLIVGIIFVGMGFGFLFFGPVSDAIGRKNSVYLGIAVFAMGSTVSAMSHDLTTMLWGRFLQGLGAGCCRVVTVSMIKDRFSGREMAKALSFVMIVFILVPAIAPTVGQLIMNHFHWRAIFIGLIFFALGNGLWLLLRQPETLSRQHRRPLSRRTISLAFGETLTHGPTMLYTLASGLMFSCVVAYITMAQQLLQFQYQLGTDFPYYFGTLSLFIGLSSFCNTRFVQYFGLKNIVLSSLGFICLNSLGMLIYLGLHEDQLPLWGLLGFLGTTFFCFGLIFGNLTTLAIHPLGHIAGSANAVISTIQTLIAALLGSLVGQLYDGTAHPLVLGYFMLCAGAIVLTYFAKDPIEGQQVLRDGKPVKDDQVAAA